MNKEITNNSVNLCDSCKYAYPECPSGKDDVLFGNGKGNDNICCCNKYQPAQEVKPISYQDCSNAMLMMWMDKVLTDVEYYRIMDKLNAHEKKMREGE